MDTTNPQSMKMCGAYSEKKLAGKVARWSIGVPFESFGQPIFGGIYGFPPKNAEFLSCSAGMKLICLNTWISSALTGAVAVKKILGLVSELSSP